MPKNKSTVTRILWEEVEEDDFFAHRIVGAIGLMKVTIGKLTMALQQSQTQNIKCNNDPEKESMPTKINADCYQLDELQIQFMNECMKYYSDRKNSKKKKILSCNDELYGNNFRLTEIAELTEERLQRKIKMEDSFIKILRNKRTVTGG